MAGTHRSTRLKQLVRSVPLVGPLASHAWNSPRYARRLYDRLHFGGSAAFWERAYSKGGSSGPGSYGRLAEFKAEVLNDFVHRKGIRTVGELGCGDGHQVSLARYPYYVGLDVSQSAVERCRERFAGDETREFRVYRPGSAEPLPRVELALSLDVIFHLVEDDVFDRYMRDLFSMAERWVVVYSSNRSENPGVRRPQLRHRRFSDWIEANAPEWPLVELTPNRYPAAKYGSEGSHADFFMYQRTLRPGPEDPPAAR